jgi:hypothetical protein
LKRRQINRGKIIILSETRYFELIRGSDQQDIKFIVFFGSIYFRSVTSKLSSAFILSSFFLNSNYKIILFDSWKGFLADL